MLEICSIESLGRIIFLGAGVVFRNINGTIDAKWARDSVKLWVGDLEGSEDYHGTVTGLLLQ
jgi:hypothetical protein